MANGRAAKVKSLGVARANREGHDRVASEATMTGGAVDFTEADFLDPRTNRQMPPSELLGATSCYVPRASAGDYRRVFAALGASDTIAFDQTSSAGDWTFLVKIGRGWQMASQVQAHTGGFRYEIADGDVMDDPNCFEIWDDIAALIEERDPGYFRES